MKNWIVTLGDLAGVGPDIVLKHAAARGLDDAVVVADMHFMLTRAKQLGLSASKTSERIFSVAGNKVTLVPLPYLDLVIPGQPDVAQAHYNEAALEVAVAACLQGQYRGLLTGPIHKALMNQAGIAFTGHTEWIQKRTQAKHAVMLLLSGQRRVALCTTHLALKDVPQAITQKRIADLIEVLHHDLQKYFHLTNPKIAVTGLNPHAGDEGNFGREEIEIIQPAVMAARAKQYAVTGPFAADTLFQPTFWDQYDVILAMYHDQGLAPLKALHFGHTVNMTLGLPIVRVSVDHGTAYDKAGTLAANEASFAAALSLLRSLKV